MTNKSVVHQITKGQSGRPHWIFIPGGPGMGPEYMISLAKTLELNGAITVFELSGDPLQGDPEAIGNGVLRGWQAHWTVSAW
jgi:hypothetical protein